MNPKYWGGKKKVWIIYIENTLQIQQQIITIKPAGFFYTQWQLHCFSYKGSSPKARVLAQMDLNDIFLYAEKRHILQNISSDIVLDGYTVIIFIGRVGWKDLGTSHLCKDQLPHGAAQVGSWAVSDTWVWRLWSCAGCDSCSSAGGGKRSVSACFSSPSRISLHCGWNDTRRKNSGEGKCSVFSVLKFNSK